MTEIYLADLRFSEQVMRIVIYPHQLQETKAPDTPFFIKGRLVVSAKFISGEPGLILDQGPEILVNRKFGCHTLDLLDHYVELTCQVKLNERTWSGQLFGLACIVEAKGQTCKEGQVYAVRVKEVGETIRGECLGEGGNQDWKSLERRVLKMLKIGST